MPIFTIVPFLFWLSFKAICQNIESLLYMIVVQYKDYNHKVRVKGECLLPYPHVKYSYKYFLVKQTIMI